MRLISCLCFYFLTIMVSSAAERNVTDTMGRELTIPDNPQRIVVMSEPAIGLPLMELGIEPFASYGRADDGSYKIGADFIDIVFGKNHKKPIGIGNGAQIDLEKLHDLKPDLIIGTEFDLDKVKQLSTAAPVYLQHFTTGHLDNFYIEENLAKLLHKEQAFKALNQNYQKEIAETKALLPKDWQGKSFLPVIIMDQINMVGEGLGVTQPFLDLGMKRYILPNDNNSEKNTSQIILPINAETFGTLNPDLLIVISSWGAMERDEQATRQALEKLVPGFTQYMKPAAEKRIIFLDGAKVFTPTFASAHFTLEGIKQWAKENSN